MIIFYSNFIFLLWICWISFYDSMYVLSTSICDQMILTPSFIIPYLSLFASLQATFGVTTENLNHPRWVGGEFTCVVYRIYLCRAVVLWMSYHTFIRF